MDYKTIREPWLIQRGSFKDLPEAEIAGLDSLIRYDYMGSSEFEWGALPKSLKSITTNWSKYVHFQIDSIIDNDGQYLQVICHADQKEEVTSVIIDLFNKDSKIRLKEHSGMYDYLYARSQYSLDKNFWWDVTGSDYQDAGLSNNWMCCFGNNIRSLIIAIRKVWCKHNSSDALPEFGPEIPKAIIKPKPSQLQVTKNNTQIIVINTLGNKTIINKKSIQDVSVLPDRIDVRVLTRAGKDKILSIVEGSSSSRKVLENLLIELKEWVCRSR
jgi:hypothetical protein